MIGWIARGGIRKALRTGMISAGLVGAVLLAMDSAQALAQSAATPTEDWQVVPIQGPDGNLGYCVARNRYSDGVGLSVARTTDGVVALLINKPDGNFEVGEIGSKLSIDNLVSGEGRANVRASDVIEIVAGPNRQFYQALRSGRVLTIESDVGTFRFALRGTSRALADLVTCVDSGGGEGVTGTPEPAAARTPRSGGDVDMTVPDGVESVVEGVGYGGMVPLAASPGSRVWGVIALTIQEVTVDDGKDLQALRAEVAADLQRACQGTFQSAFEDSETIANGAIVTGNASCTVNDRETYVSLLVQDAGEGKFYIYSHEGDLAWRARLDRERDAVAAALRR